SIYVENGGKGRPVDRLPCFYRRETPSLCMLSHMLTFCKLFNDFFVEIREVIRCTAGYQPLLHYHRAVFPQRTRIDQILADMHYRRHLSPLYDLSVNQYLWTVADRGNGLSRLKKSFYKINGLFIHPEF